MQIFQNVTASAHVLYAATAARDGVACQQACKHTSQQRRATVRARQAIIEQAEQKMDTITHHPAHVGLLHFVRAQQRAQRADLRTTTRKRHHEQCKMRTDFECTFSRWQPTSLHSSSDWHAVQTVGIACEVAHTHITTDETKASHEP
jgi:hypothetical protein